MISNEDVCKIENLLGQLDDVTFTVQSMKTQLEEIIADYEPKNVVCERQEGYQTAKHPQVILMPDFCMDEYGRVTNIEFHLVEWT